MSELSVEDTRHMAGMRGTGGDTIVADGVFVPEERVRLGRLGDRHTQPVPAPQGLQGALARFWGWA